MKRRNLLLKLSVAAFAGVALFTLPAMSAPLSAIPKTLVNAAPVDDGLIVQVAERRGGGARGGAVHRGGAAARGGAAYRGGAVVRGGTVVRGGGGAYYAGTCDPSYQYCGGAAYSSGGGAVVRSGGAVVRSGGAYARGGAAVRGGGARGAHVAHRGGGGRRR